MISDLGTFDTDLPLLSGSPFATWPVPSLARAKGTTLGALDLGHFNPTPVWSADNDCNVHNEFPKNSQKPMEDLVDAFLYLGPQDLRLIEPMPADIALDVDYLTELLRRMALAGLPGGGAGTLKEFDEQIVRAPNTPYLQFLRTDPTRRTQ